MEKLTEEMQAKLVQKYGKGRPTPKTVMAQIHPLHVDEGKQAWNKSLTVSHRIDPTTLVRLAQMAR